MSLVYASTHFPWSELACRDGAQVPDALKPNARHLCLQVLEPIRAKFGGPLVVVSFYRTPTHNRRVGGAKASRHLKADGADVRPVSVLAVPRLVALVEAMIAAGELPALGGFGIYPGWIHVDTRPRLAGTPIARWGGNGEGSER